MNRKHLSKKSLLAAGVLVKLAEAVDKYRALLLGDMIGLA